MPCRRSPRAIASARLRSSSTTSTRIPASRLVASRQPSAGRQPAVARAGRCRKSSGTRCFPAYRHARRGRGGRDERTERHDRSTRAGRRLPRLPLPADVDLGAAEGRLRRPGRADVRPRRSAARRTPTRTPASPAGYDLRPGPPRRRPRLRGHRGGPVLDRRHPGGLLAPGRAARLGRAARRHRLVRAGPLGRRRHRPPAHLGARPGRRRRPGDADTLGAAAHRGHRLAGRG